MLFRSVSQSRYYEKPVQGRGAKGNRKAAGGEISVLAEMIDLMIQKKVAHAVLGEMTVTLSPLAFQVEPSLSNDGNDAQNIDELLYIKKPMNGFPKI